MEEANRKRMKNVAILLGAITLGIIILAMYKLYIARAK